MGHILLNVLVVWNMNASYMKHPLRAISFCSRLKFNYVFYYLIRPWQFAIEPHCGPLVLCGYGTPVGSNPQTHDQERWHVNTLGEIHYFPKSYGSRKISPPNIYASSQPQYFIDVKSCLASEVFPTLPFISEPHHTMNHLRL